MKKGDTVPVTISGHVVAQARVAEIESGRATLVVPGTVVVMAVRTELDRAPSDTGTEHLVTGVDRADPTESTGVDASETQTTGAVEPESASAPEQTQSAGSEVNETDSETTND